MARSAPAQQSGNALLAGHEFDHARAMPPRHQAAVHSFFNKSDREIASAKARPPNFPAKIRLSYWAGLRLFLEAKAVTLFNWTNALVLRRQFLALKMGWTIFCVLLSSASSLMLPRGHVADKPRFVMC